MKYKTITFDANKPITKQITEPLNSDYGVAVKMKVDGQYADIESLSVNGTSSTETRNGWTLAELSTGSTPDLKLMDVEIDAVKKEHVEIDETQELKNTFPFPQTMNVTVPLSSVVEDTATLYATDVEMAQGYADGVPSLDYLVKFYTNPNTYYMLIEGKWSDEKGGLLDSIELTPESYLRFQVNVPASSTVEGRLVFKADIANGTSTYTFPLQVQEWDLGYIEK